MTSNQILAVVQDHAQDLGGRADELGFRSRTPLDEVLGRTLE